MAKEIPYEFPKLQKLLRDSGIDPSVILADSISKTGYTAIRKGADGKSLILPDGRLWTDEMQWPTPEFGDAVLNTMLEDLADRGREHPITVTSEHTPDHVVLLRRIFEMDSTSENLDAWHQARESLNEGDRARYEELMKLFPELPLHSPETKEARSTT